MLPHHLRNRSPRPLRLSHLPRPGIPSHLHAVNVCCPQPSGYYCEQHRTTLKNQHHPSVSGHYMICHPRGFPSPWLATGDGRSVPRPVRVRLCQRLQGPRQRAPPHRAVVCAVLYSCCWLRGLLTQQEGTRSMAELQRITLPGTAARTSGQTELNEAAGRPHQPDEGAPLHRSLFTQ